MPKLDLHYVEPKLVDLYDLENPHGPDTDFYIQLAADLNAQTIVDLGCGTGLLTRQLAVDGRRVIGIDPAAAMLAYARRQHGAERVDWIEGTAVDIGQTDADLAVMTSNVAQVFLDDDEFERTFNDLQINASNGTMAVTESQTKPGLDPAKVEQVASAVREMESLRQEGLITEAEFEQKRRKLLDQID